MEEKGHPVSEGELEDIQRTFHQLLYDLMPKLEAAYPEGASPALLEVKECITIWETQETINN